MMIRHFSLIVLVFILASSVMAEDSRRDGNWWLDQSRLMKVAYMVGFFDGMDLGHKFSYWKYVNSDLLVGEKALNSYNEYTDKYFKNVSNLQLVDGLDTFFKDYRNRRIMVYDAVWLVVNGIAGTPQAELDKMIESWRQIAR